MIINPGTDWHTHSSQSDGADSLEVMADAAVAVGLHSWGISDHVRADTGWLPDYVDAVRTLRRDDLEIRCGVEAKMLDSTGRLDLPSTLPAMDYLLIADHQFPGSEGPQHPDVVRDLVRAGRLTANAAVEQLVQATANAVRTSPLPPIVAHLFSLLPKCGFDEDDVAADLIDVLADACLAADAAVEANEKWRCPAPRTLARLSQRGVRLVPGSDAHCAADVGRSTYLAELAAGQ